MSVVYFVSAKSLKNPRRLLTLHAGVDCPHCAEIKAWVQVKREEITNRTTHRCTYCYG